MKPTNEILEKIMKNSRNNKEESIKLEFKRLKQSWRAGYIERCKSGSGRGLGKPITVMWQGGSFLLYKDIHNKNYKI